MPGVRRTAPLLAAALLGTLALAGSSPLVFEDNGRRVQPAGRPEHGAGALTQQGGGGGGGRAPGPLPPAYNTATPQPPPAATDPDDGRGLHKKKRKKKKVICGIANLIAGRDAAGGEQRQDVHVQHRAARAVGQAGSGPSGPSGPGGQAQAPGDGRSYGSGLGVAGFLLGTLVGSKLGYGYAQHSPHQQQYLPHQPGQQPAQTQVQVQTPGVLQPLIPAVPVVPVRPVIPVDPAPVHEDYDDTDQDDEGVLGYAGGGGVGSLCDQLQHRPEPGPLDSHFPLLAGILNGGGGGHQAQRPYRPPPRPQYYHRPQQQAPGGLLYSYVKPWTDLFFRR